MHRIVRAQNSNNSGILTVRQLEPLPARALASSPWLVYRHSSGIVLATTTRSTNAPTTVQNCQLSHTSANSSSPYLGAPDKTSLEEIKSEIHPLVLLAGKRWQYVPQFAAVFNMNRPDPKPDVNEAKEELLLFIFIIHLFGECNRRRK